MSQLKSILMLWVTPGSQEHCKAGTPLIQTRAGILPQTPGFCWLLPCPCPSPVAHTHIYTSSTHHCCSCVTFPRSGGQLHCPLTVPHCT